LLDKQQLIKYAVRLRYTLQDILSEDLKCMGTVSLACCYDVVEHHDRDMERLYKVHQRTRLVHQSKHIAYAAFWIRKLKPVDSSFPITEVEDAIKSKRPIDETKEVRDVNERICLWCMYRLLRAAIIDGKVEPPKGMTVEQFLPQLDSVFLKFREEPASGPASEEPVSGPASQQPAAWPVLKDRFDAHVYDMRYRTFGPHHLVHLVNYWFSEASHGNN
jgi:hypothetical protein